MKTDCALTDFYCQCGKNAEFIQKTTLECLCTSECTTSDLASTSSPPLHPKAVKDHHTNNLPQQRSTASPTSSAARPSPTTARPTTCPLTPSPPASATPATPPPLLRPPASPAPWPAPPLLPTAPAPPWPPATALLPPKATSSSADFEGAAVSSFGMSIAAIAVGGLAFVL
jgi:hypothetical protein